MKYAYRIVNILLAVAILLSAFFVNFVTVRMETDDSLADVFGQMTDDSTQGVAVEEPLSIKRVVNIIRGKDDLSSIVSFNGGSFSWPSEFSSLNTRLIVFALSFVLMVLLAVFLIVFSICSNKKLPVLITGIVGIGLDIAMIKSFRSAATSVYKGTVDVAGYIIDKILGSGVISSLVGGVTSSYIKFVFSLSGVQNALLFLFIAVALWTVIFYVVDIGDPDAKKEKELEKKAQEAKKAAKKAKKAAQSAKKAAKDASQAAKDAETAAKAE